MNDDKHASLAGIGLALAAAALWGTTGTAQSLAPAGLSPFWTGALRLVVSAAFFAVAASTAGRRGPPVGAGMSGRDAGATLMAGVCMAAYNLAFFAGVKATGVAVGTALAIGSGPVWAGLLQSLLARKPPAPVWWLGTLLAVAGGSLMVLDGGGALHLDRTGVALCLAAGLAYAVYTLLSHGLVARAAPAVVTLRVFGIAAVLASVGAWAVAGPVAVTPAGWLTVGYLGVVATGIAYLLFSHALRRISAATGVTLALAEPVTAFVLALLVVGERPAAGAIAGLGLVLAGLVIVVWTEATAAPRRPAG